MSNERKIRQGIRDMVGADDPDTLIGTVDSVDDQKLTCTVKIDEEILRYKVRLRSVITDDTGVYVLPTVDSKVTIAKVDNGGHWAVVKVSEVDALHVKIGQTTLEMTDGSIKMNGGNNHGLVKVAELTDKIKALEQKVNDLVTAHNTHIHITTATVLIGAVGVIAPTTTLETPIQTMTQQADIENTDVTH